jgi:hypothetical protein
MEQIFHTGWRLSTKAGLFSTGAREEVHLQRFAHPIVRSSVVRGRMPVGPPWATAGSVKEF